MPTLRSSNIRVTRQSTRNDSSLLTNHRLPINNEPRIGKIFPNTWRKLLNEWENRNLTNYERVRKNRWEQKIRSRYNKRLRAITQIRRYAFRMDMSMKDSATHLDIDRVHWQIRFQGLTMTQHVELVENTSY
jgi:hypothetical protein